MWNKFREESELPNSRSGITLSEVLSPMLEEPPIIATISECTLDVKTEDIFTPKLKERLQLCCYVILIIFVPLIVFVLVLEWRRVDLSDYQHIPLVAINGTFHLANTACGPVQGMARDGGFEFLGIPFAIPPTSDNYTPTSSSNKKKRNTNYMWEPGTPQFRLEHCWKDVLLYPKTKPHECLQIAVGLNGSSHTFGDQDCLTLDIFTPYVGYDTPSPVVVVIATPSLIGGWPDLVHKDQASPTAALAREKGVVFVVPRFRLGPLGFLPRMLLNDTSSIIKNSKNFEDSIIQIQRTQLQLDRSYNLGLTDLTAALMWVGTNIEHFGGDPSLVTLLGWGKGADLVTSLTATRPPKGHPFLFTQAWVTHNTLAGVEEKQSNTATNRTATFGAGYELWSNSPCNKNNSAYDPLCLMALPAREIVESVPREWLTAGGHTWLEPDNFIFRQPAATVWSKGEPPNDFPLVLGSTAHGAVDTILDDVPFPCKAIESQVTSNVATLLNSSDPKKDANKFEILKNASNIYEKIALLSDEQFACPLLALAKKADRLFNSDVYFYLVSFEETVTCLNGTRLRLAGGLADISAILGHYRATDEESSQFSSQLQNVFYRFVIDGALPGKVRANQGYYDFGQKIKTHPSYPPCEKLG